MKKITFLFLGFYFLNSYAQNTGLFVCDSADGMKSIVSADQIKNQKGYCRPYQKGDLAQKDNTGQVKKEGKKGELTVISLKDVDFSKTDNAKNSISLAPNKATETPTVLLGDGDNAPKSQEDAIAQAISNAATGNNNPVATAAPQGEVKEKIKIYFCPDDRGARIIEDTQPPEPTCVSVGDKAEVQDPRALSAEERSAYSQKNTVLRGKAKNAAEVLKNSAGSQDIYKCFDNDGLVTYVAENQKDKFKGCSFFSKSFSSAKRDLAQKGQKTASLTDLAAKGVGADNKKEEVLATAALRCSGAGQVNFNGEIKNYDCAARSLDMTSGTSGGEVVLGDRRAQIAAHNFDYLNTGGSCGGTVTTAEGRVLHLEPTKDCPEEFKIEAKRIEREYVRSISVNINVSGQFRQRQKELAPQVNQIAREVGIDPFLVHAVISAESAYKPRAVSHAGAMGLMQLMPFTAKRFGVRDAFNTGENIRGGATYLKYLLKFFNGNYQLAIAAYNAGEGNVKKYGYKIPPFIETRAYVPKVMEYYRKYKNDPSIVGL